MITLLKTTTLFLSFICGILTLNAQMIDQSLVSNVGNTGESASVSATWTIGEVSVSTLNVDNLTISEGMQQGNIIIKSLVRELVYKVRIFPNPVSHTFIIEGIERYQRFKIVDLKGGVLMDHTITNNTKEINISHLKSGTYLLIIDNQLTHTIIKN